MKLGPLFNAFFLFFSCVVNNFDIHFETYFPVPCFCVWKMVQIFVISYAIECTTDILQKYPRRDEIPIPTLRPATAILQSASLVRAREIIQSAPFALPFNIVAAILIVIVLFLNQKKYNNSKGLHMFCLNFIGILSLFCIFNLADNVYKAIWSNLWYKTMICKYSDISSKITAPAEISYPYWYTVVKFFQGPIFTSYVQYVLPLMVGFYQMNTYLACSSPLIYKRYFNNNMTKYYYVIMHMIGIALFVIFIFRADLSTDLIHIYDNTMIVIQTLISVFHIGLSYLALRVIFTYQKKRTAETRDLKGFFLFAIIPMLMSAFTIFLKISYLIVDPFYDNNPTKIQATGGLATNFWYSLRYHITYITELNEMLIWIFEPIIHSFLLLLCIPVYKKAFKKVFTRQNDSHLFVSRNSGISKTQNTV